MELRVEDKYQIERKLLIVYMLRKVFYFYIIQIRWRISLQS